MFFPGGLAGLLMMHVPAIKMGKASKLVVPYITTLIPALIGILGLSALVEMTFHVRHSSVGDEEMTVFWTTFDSHDILPWAVAIGVTVVAFAVMRMMLPTLRAAWADANSTKANTSNGGAA